MKVEIKDQDNNQKEVFVSMSVKDMEPHLKRIAKQKGSEIKLKGFRKGFVPYDVIEKSIGKEILWNEASIDAVDSAYRKALEENNIKPAGKPRIDIKKSVPGNNFEFIAVVPLEPEVNLPDYHTISKEILSKHKKQKIEVDEHEVEETLEALANSRKASGEGEVKIDDEFAKSIGSFETLDQLKKNIREGIKKEKEQQQKEVKRLKVIEGIRKKTDIAISDILVDNELTVMRDDLENYVSSNGMSFEDYLKKANQTEEDLKKSWTEKAKARVEVSFILNAIADSENIEPSEQDIEEQANRYLSQFDSPEQAMSSISPELLKAHIRNMIRGDQVLAMLEGKDVKNVVNNKK